MTRAFRLFRVQRHKLGIFVAVRVDFDDALDGGADVERTDGEPRVSGFVVDVVERHAAAEDGEPRVDAVDVTTH